MKKLIVSICASVVAITSMSFGILSRAGIAGSVESPGEKNCTQCHLGTANSGKGSLVITAPTLTDWKYELGKTYAINVTITQSAINLFGFAFEAISDSGTDAGMIEVTNSIQTYIDSSDVSGTMRKGITHAVNGGKSSGTHTFTFNWTAPTKDIGPVTFYSAGNAANGNNLATGDYIYTKTQIVLPVAVGITKQTVFDITIFPNPTADKLQITANTTNKITVSIVDMNGRKLMEKRDIVGDSSFDISNLPKGFYIVKAETSTVVIVKTLVKN